MNATGEPVLAITAGMHASASTWVFNVAREVVAEAVGGVHACHLLHPDDLARERAQGARHIVAKTHGWDSLAADARAWRARVIVSVRDPRDAIVSVMQRFGEPFDRALGGIAQDCRAAAACAEAGFAVLRYEDRFFEQPASVRLLARHLGLDVSEAAAERIFAAYTTDAVRALAAGVADLPAARVAGHGAARFDRLTQITHGHIGDTRTGKWHDVLARDQQMLARMVLRPVLARFGYA